MTPEMSPAKKKRRLPSEELPEDPDNLQRKAKNKDKKSRNEHV